MKPSNELNFDKLLSSIDNDMVLFKELLEIFVEDLKISLKELREAINLNDMEKVSYIAHRIAAPCGQMGAKELYAELKKLEEISTINRNITEIKETYQKVQAIGLYVAEFIDQKLKTL